jgi:hypothetical protein
MDINKADIPISIRDGEHILVNLRWFRGASRYNNGSTLYKGKYQFRYLIGRCKEASIKKYQDANP